MNIVILSFHKLGGSGIVAYDIGQAMAIERGHEVHFMGLQPPFRFHQSEFSNKIYYHKVHLKEYPVFDFQPYALALASQLSELIIRFNIDIIHSHYAIPHAICAILAKNISRKNVKCITTLHGTDITILGSHPSMLNITRYAIEQSDVVTAVSENLKIQTFKSLNIKMDIKVIYNFINPQLFELKSNFLAKPILDDRYVILHSSNLRQAKNPLNVIRIFKSILDLNHTQRLHKKLELWIIGEGPLECEMATLSEQLGIQNQVKFLGIQNSIYPFTEKACLFLLPSSLEAFGLAALEAMYCGIPAITSDVGGLPEVITHGETGFLCAQDDIHAASKYAMEILSNPHKHWEMAKKSHDKALNFFNRTKILNAYENLYQS